MNITKEREKLDGYRWGKGGASVGEQHTAYGIDPDFDTDPDFDGKNTQPMDGGIVVLPRAPSGRTSVFISGHQWLNKFF
jgi:hypothetical protein